MVRRLSKMPTDRRHPWAARLPKPGTAIKKKAFRVNHQVCPAGKAFSTLLTVRGNQRALDRIMPSCLHGGLHHRGREATILVQQISNWRLLQYGISHATMFYDQTNAFGSLHLDTFDQTDWLHLSQHDRPCGK